MPKYTLDVKVFAQVQLEAETEAEAIEAARDFLGEGEMRLGECKDGSPLCATLSLDDSDPDVVEVSGEGVSECQNCLSRWGQADLNEVRHLSMRVAPGERMPSGECPECGAVCHPVAEEAA